MDIGDTDSSLYLSDIDGPKETREKEPLKIRSAIVKPNQVNQSLANHSRSKKRRRIEKVSLPDSRGSSAERKSHGRAVAHHHTTTRNGFKPHALSDTTSKVHVQTETRGTQTDRTGPCKCARQLQQRNQRKRSENKTNKQIVDTLERVNIIKYSN